MAAGRAHSLGSQLARAGGVNGVNIVISVSRLGGGPDFGLAGVSASQNID